MASYNNIEMNKGVHDGIETALPKEQSFDEEDTGDTYHESIKGHTRNDRVDMSRMGKIQELRVNAFFAISASWSDR